MEEVRPPSLLQRPRVEPKQILIGLGTMVGAHALIPLLLVLLAWLLTVLDLAVPASEREPAISEDEVIAAEFVRLGKEFDPRKLPSRRVPPKVKRRPDTVAVSKNPDRDKRKREKDEENPPEAEEDMLDNLVERTKAFAEDVEYEQEGDPDGIADGTATEAKAGNIYFGKLKLFFQRGWGVPVTIDRPDKLMAIVAVQIDDEGTLREVRLNKSSGNPDFDHSVVAHVENLIRSGATIPEPPPELAEEFHGQTRAVRFHGKDAR